jgi:predicted NBD/HSP70 family sugar kinase
VTLQALSDRLSFPVLIDNGAKTTTQAESWYGSAKGSEHAIVVLIGDGAGAGIITNGRLYRGSSSSAGEWGHTKISTDGIRCRCGSRGCVETFVGASAVLERWEGRDGGWLGRETDGIDALFAAWHAGDADARLALDDLIDHLGLALSNLVNLYNPQKIIIGGWLGDRIAGELLPELAAATRRFSLEQPGNEAVLERSQLGQDAPTLGAATLALDRFIESGWPN